MGGEKDPTHCAKECTGGGGSLGEKGRSKKKVHKEKKRGRGCFTPK